MVRTVSIRRPAALASAALLLALAVSACSGDSPADPPPPPPDPALGPVPELFNLGVPTEALFDLSLVTYRSRTFFEFGFEAVSFDGSRKALPHFSYAVDTSTEIVSPMDGYVAAVHLQDAERGDYALWLKPHGDTTLWLVEVDHVGDVAVATGQSVTVGERLGRASLGGVELQVNGPEAHMCPWSIFAPSVVDGFVTRIEELAVVWDSAKWALPEDHPSHPSYPEAHFRPFDIDAMAMPGCRTMTVPYGG